MKPGRKEKRIGELLVEQGAITTEQLNEALRIQKERGGRVVQVLINQGALTEEGLLGCLGSQQGVSSVNLRLYSIDPDLIQCVPLPFAVTNEVMPLDRLGKNLTVAMAVPMDLDTREKLEDMTGLRVRAVLCSRADVRAAIEQYYGVSPAEAATAGAGGVQAAAPVAADTAEDVPVPGGQPQPGPEAVRLRNVTDILDAVDTFPLLPAVHTQVMQAVTEPDASAAHVTELIQQDPTLSTNVLKLANSAAYAARHRFDSIQRAVAYIGLRELHSMVISSAVMQALSTQTNLDLDRLFQQAFHCGMVTKIICDAAKVGDREMAFTAGLLHDLGTIVLRFFSQERLLQIEAAVTESGRPRVEVEEDILGISASEIAFQLMQRWNIPDTLEGAIRFHDRLDTIPDPPPVSVAIALAVRCLARVEAGDDFARVDENGLTANLLGRLSLDAGALAQIGLKYREGLENVIPLDFSAGN